MIKGGGDCDDDDDCCRKVNELRERIQKATLERNPKHKRGRGVRHMLSATGGYDLASRASKGYAGAVHLCDVARVRQSKTSSYRWERRFAMGIRLTNIDFNDRWRAFMTWYHLQLCRAAAAAPAPPAENVFTYSVLCAGSDATNTAAAQQMKGMNTELIATYFAPQPTPAQLEEMPDDAMPPDSCGVKMWPELLQVPSGCTGRVVRDLLLKALRSVHAHTWLDDDVNSYTPRWTPTMQPARIHMPFHLHVYVFADDQGPDQKAALKFVDDDIARFLFRLKFGHYCSRHSMHLAVKSHLKVMETVAYPHYFSSVAKLVNVWRTSSYARLIRTKWIAIVGPIDRKSVLMRLIPRALRGRWGSISATEAYLKECIRIGGVKGFLRVWRAAFIRDDGGDGDGDPPPGLVADEEPGAAVAAEAVALEDEEQRDFTKRLTKWKGQTVAEISKTHFWVMIMICSISRGPIDHSPRWLQAPVDVDKYGELPRSVYWCCDIVSRTLDEFAALLHPESCSTTWSFLFDGFEGVEGWHEDPDYVGTAVLSVLHLYSDFKMREVVL